jgi:thiamine-phosphate pyrophosphorylase
MKISKLHYISQEINEESHGDLIAEACEAGADWIQLRVKNKSFEETLIIAQQVKEICNNYNVKLIINDYVSIAKEIQADGVHLGKTDMDPLKAREILGSNFIIGGTANTFEDIKKLHLGEVDYIGLGPFRFTTTKENLSPVLGLEGYRELLKQCKEENIRIPVIAIGGIIPEDVTEIIETGIHGVAVSAVINKAKNKKEIIELMNFRINEFNNSTTH